MNLDDRAVGQLLERMADLRGVAGALLSWTGLRGCPLNARVSDAASSRRLIGRGQSVAVGPVSS
ncbi:hypothetical protein DYH09_11585 [bacterium CPR1]|nr:hypothetical protein [bacterium CPR1]